VRRQRDDVFRLMSRVDSAVLVPDTLDTITGNQWGVHEDNDFSAYSGRTRPAYERLCEKVFAGEVDIVIVAAQDRLWRSVVEHQTFLAYGRAASLKKVITVSGEIDPADANDEWLSTIQAANAKHESAITAGRIRRAQRDRVEKGEFTGGQRAYGHDKTHTKIVQREAKIIREATRRFLTGEAMNAIVSDLRRRGVVTVYGNPFTNATLTKVLTSPRIAGLRDYHGTLYPAPEPAIITPEEREEIVRIFDSRRTGPRTRTTTHLLAGNLLKCGKCGGSLRAQKWSQRGLRYVCPQPGAGGCGGLSVVGDYVEETVVDLIVAELDSPRFAKRLQRERKALATENAEIAKVRDARDRDRASLLRFEDDYGDGNIDAVTFRRQSERVQARIEAADRKLDGIDSVHAAHRVGVTASQLRKAWPKMTVTEKQGIIRGMARHFTIEPANRHGNRWDASRVVPDWR
jgi:DNA invertase Pin-like site-specific DNA recombinase